MHIPPGVFTAISALLLVAVLPADPPRWALLTLGALVAGNAALDLLRWRDRRAMPEAMPGEPDVGRD